MKRVSGKTDSKTIIRCALILTFGLTALVGLPSRNLCSLAATIAPFVNPQITRSHRRVQSSTGSDQNVQVSGSNFRLGLTVTVFFPGGGSGTLSGSQNSERHERFVHHGRHSQRPGSVRHQGEQPW